jgi:hypothetical protein
LTERDHRDALTRYREGQAPITDDHFGHFTAVVYDHTRNRIAFVPDRFAQSATYFSKAAGMIAVSDRASSVASLIGAALDGQSLLALMRGIHFPFGRSLFANVSRVMCGCYVDVDLRTRKVSMRRWIPLYGGTVSLPFRDGVELSAGAVARVADRITRSPRSVIDLTGGNDTRLLAAAVESVHPNGVPESVSWRVAGAEGSADVVVARRIAGRCGWPLRVLDRYPPAEASCDRLHGLAVQADGSFTVDAAFGRVEQENRHSAAAECLIGAIGGELLRGFFWRHEMLALGRTSDVNYQALLSYRLYDTNGIDPKRLGPEAPSQREHDAVIMDGYRFLGGAGGERRNPYKLDVMYLHKLCYGAGNSQSWLSGFRRVRLPLLASEVCATAITFPWWWRMNRRLILRVISQLSPRLSSIPNDKQEPMVALGWTSWPGYAATGARVGSNVLRRMARRYLGRPAGGTQSLGEMPPESWRAALWEGQYLRSAVEPSLIQGIVDDVSATHATPDALRAFYTLLTAELLLGGVPGLSRRVDFSAVPAPLAR